MEEVETEDFLGSNKADHAGIQVFLLARPQDILVSALGIRELEIQLGPQLEVAEQSRAEKELIVMNDCLMHCVESSLNDQSRHFVDVKLAGIPSVHQDIPEL